MNFRYQWFASVGLFFFTLMPVFAGQIQLNEINFNIKNNRIQAIFSLSDDFQYRYLILSNPDRVVIDLLETQLKVNLDQLNLNRTGIERIRAAHHLDSKKLRVVLDLNSPRTVNVFRDKTTDGRDKHLIIEWMAQRQAPIPKLTIHKQTTPTDVIVVIDPGHGGRDPGAKGTLGLLEKNVVLAISKELAQLINEQSGMQVVLTREDDRYVGLRDRLEFARGNKADLFISIHADAFKNQQAKGASVFALSQGAATSEAGRWLAEKNNYTQLAGVYLNELEDKNDILRGTLIDLSQIATISASLQLGANVLEKLGGSSATLHSNSVEQAGFLVLTSPDIPSILVETGFISHAVEERNLGSKRYRQQLAKMILSGIKAYLNDNPPLGSLFEMKQISKQYTVVAGDNLSKISKREQIDIVSLKNANALKDDLLQPGQILLILPQAYASLD